RQSKNDSHDVLVAQPQHLVKVDRDGREILLKDAVPLVSGDKLWIECDLPPGWQGSAFWFDTEGRLTELSPLKIDKGKTVDRIAFPPEGAVTVAGPPGTELIVICARRGSRVGHAEVAALLPVGRPLTDLPDPEVVWLDRERVTLNSAFAGITRAPGAWSASKARDAIKPIQDARERLGSRVEYVVGVACAHRESGASLGGSESPIGAAREISRNGGR